MAQTGEHPSNLRAIINLLELERHMEELNTIYSTDICQIAFHADQKVFNILAGLAGSASKFPCSLGVYFRKSQ